MQDNYASEVVAHYGRDDLMERIHAALAAAGFDPEAPTIDQLGELDHLHGGGHQTTIAQARLAGISEGSHVLDAGCGIGGPSRFLASQLGCTVEGIDLTPDYISVARRLNQVVGLQGRIRLCVGSITNLPYQDGIFDAVLCQNVSMNVKDKAAMFGESFRVLKPGGIYTISHIAGGPEGDPIYPLPWARTAETSFMETPEAMLQGLQRAGFADVRDMSGSSAENPGGGSAPKAIGATPAMGDDMPARIANNMASMQEGRAVAMLIVARKPG